MDWTVVEHWDFTRERADLPDEFETKLAEIVLAIEKIGPHLGRLLVDTLSGSKNMKEIRCAVQGAWRFAFASIPIDEL